jgi:hypothetical protein
MLTTTEYSLEVCHLTTSATLHPQHSNSIPHLAEVWPYWYLICVYYCYCTFQKLTDTIFIFWTSSIIWFLNEAQRFKHWVYGQVKLKYLIWWTPQGPYTLSVKLSDFTVLHHTWWKNWVNCAVLTGNSTGPRTVLSNHLSHRELHSSLRESQFPQFTCGHHDGIISRHSISINSFSRWASHDIFLFKYHLLLHILRFLSSFRITLWPMRLANSKQQPCFYPP